MKHKMSIQYLLFAKLFTIAFFLSLSSLRLFYSSILSKSKSRSVVCHINKMLFLRSLIRNKMTFSIRLPSPSTSSSTSTPYLILYGGVCLLIFLFF